MHKKGKGNKCGKGTIFELVGNELSQKVLLRTLASPPSPATHLPSGLSQGNGVGLLMAPVIPSESTGIPASSLELGNPLVELLLGLGLQVEAGSARMVNLECKGRVLLGLGEFTQIHAFKRRRKSGRLVNVKCKAIKCLKLTHLLSKALEANEGSLVGVLNNVIYWEVQRYR